MLQQQTLVGHLLFGGIVHRFIPCEAESLQRESVTDHAGDELPVHQVTDEVGILLNQVFQHLAVHLALRKAGTVFHSHGYCKDSFRYFRVTAVDTFVVHIERIGTGAFLQVDGSSFGEQAVSGCSHVTQHPFNTVVFLRVAAGGSRHSQRHTEYFSEHIPERAHVLFRNGLLGAFQIQAQIMCASGFDAPVFHLAVPVVVAHLPGVVFVGDDDSVFGNHVGTGNQADPVVGHPSVHFHHVAQFNE